MRRLIFLVEEYSMKVLLEGLLPRFFPDLTFLCAAHEGKQDLEKSIPRKLRAWREPGVRFIVIRDCDGDDCHKLKRRLVDMCQSNGRGDTIVRIACQELEAWYLGDPDALAKAFRDENLCSIGKRSRFRNPDSVAQPSRALVDLVPGFQKVSAARRMSKYLTRDSNISVSYQALVSAIAGAAVELESEYPTGNPGGR
jgi:hypothetical protein